MFFAIPAIETALPYVMLYPFLGFPHEVLPRPLIFLIGVLSIFPSGVTIAPVAAALLSLFELR